VAERRDATKKPRDQWMVVITEEVETWREMEGGGQRQVTTRRWEGVREVDTTCCSPAVVEMRALEIVCYEVGERHTATESAQAVRGTIPGN
jgi:hypothetical protein